MTAVGLTIFGFAVFLAGVAFIYWPAALIVGGFSLTALGLFAVGFGGES
jgi:hypothetical protein